jgi:hypothetical protein
MEIAKVRLPRKISNKCLKKTTSQACEATTECNWNIIDEKCTMRQPFESTLKHSLFDEYVKVVRSHSGRETIEIIAKKLNVSFQGRSIQSICNDIQEIIHVAMHGNTIATIAKKLKLSTKTLQEGEVYYKIYQHIFDKLEESNKTPHSIPGYINFNTDKVVYKSDYHFTDRVNYARKIYQIIQNYSKKEFCEFKKGFEKIKRIGSKSVFGEAFVAYNDSSKLPIYTAIKLMPKNEDNAYEVQMYSFFQSYIINNMSPHFPMIYTAHTCSTCQYDNKRHFHGKCIALLNELAEGDLKSYLRHQHTSFDLITIYGQIIMACLAMEHAGYVHHDLHWGNFLYHSVPEYKNKYFHYIYYDSYDKKHSIYLKTNGIVLVAWDFGKMDQQHGPQDNIYVDLYRIFHINKWASDEGYPEFPPQANLICNQLKRATDSSTRNVADFLKKYNTFVHEQKSKRIQDIILLDPTTPPSNSKVINAIPYALPIPI